MVAIQHDVTAVFEPYPWQVNAWRDKSPIMLLAGGGGGGKSRLALEKINAMCIKYPESTGIILRKALEDVQNKTLPFFESRILGRQLNNTVKRTGKKHYRYSNGSLLYWGGMWDVPQREATKSIGLDAGLDWAFFEEATAFDNEDFDMILSRMRGKAAGWNQIMLSTNPDKPSHWINQRLIISKLVDPYISFYTDNPSNPSSYKQSMEMMTGLQYKRLVLGQWVQAEGAVFDNFDPVHNVTTGAEYNEDWPVRWGVDDGYVYGDGPGNTNYHPRVILFGQVTPQGGLNVFDEYVQAGQLPEVTLNECLGYDTEGNEIETEYNYQEPELASVDSSATELRARIGNRGIVNSGATHRVAEGIKRVRSMICDGNEIRMLKIHPRCRNLINEMQSYSYDERSRSVQAGQPPPKKIDDHCTDALRYMVHDL